MRRLRLAVDTLRCEADEDEVRASLLARDGVFACEVDLAAEHLEIAYDDAQLTRADLVAYLDFFGLLVKPTAAQAR